jgi:sulfotransferase family protein
VSLTFVVGSGRCGSTLLSRVLREHPDILSLSELFAALTIQRKGIPLGEYDGEQMWEILSASNPYLNALVQAGVMIPELAYPYETGRFKSETGVPVIAHMTLPMLTDDPDALFDELAAEVSSWPRREATEHYRAFFALLARREGATAVVERSGASLDLVPLLRREFPEARFVHMYRNGLDTALSMSRHHGFRLTALAEHAAKLAGVPTREDLTREDVEKLPRDLMEVLAPPFNAQRFVEYQIPLPVFGDMWSSMVSQGLKDLAELPADIRTSLSYEDLLRQPEAELTRLAEFIGVPASADWLTAGRELLDPTRAGKSAALSAADRAALEAACAPGTEAIAQESASLR